MRDLKGKVALVTGGNSGIGLGIAKVLVEEGMKVAFTYRREDHRDEALAYFRELPGAQVQAVRLDVTDREGFVRAADEIEATLGPVRVLINNAGVGIGGLIEEASYDDWDWIMAVNVGGVVNGIMTFLPRMIASDEECHIVNVSSMGGVAALGTVGLYATSKFAVVGLTEALRTDMMGRKIGVSVYCPGAVKSNIGEGAKGRPEKYAKTGYKPPEMEGNAVPEEFSRNAMDAVEAGRYVLDGIKQNKLMILSHPEFREVLQARHDMIMAAVPDVPINEARANASRWILSNDIYDKGA